ncbi:MAG: glycosyltransferase family 8 protein [Dysgonomonas sp.]
MDIVCCIDNKYAKYCAVTLVSLFENNKGEKLNIHIIALSLSDEIKSVLKNLVEKTYKQEIFIYEIGENEIIKKFPYKKNSHINISTYIRLFLPETLPQSLSKVLYIDCDIIIRNSIKELWNIDISDYALGAVEDMFSTKANNYERLDYVNTDSYFNAGVLLINLDYWRKNFVQEKLIGYILENSEKLKFYDQDALNAVLHNQKLLMPFKWNIQDGFYRIERHIRQDAWEELDKEIENPAVIHYTGSKKPWHYKSQHPHKSEYFRYLDMTQWAGERPKKDYVAMAILKLRPIAVALKLDKPRYKKITKDKTSNG